MKRIFAQINGFLLFSLFFIIILQITLRFLGISAGWPDEMCRAIYISLVFLGSGFALRDRAHLTVDIVLLIVSRRVRKILQMGAYICMIPFVVAVGYGAVQNTTWYWKSPVSTIGWLTHGHLYLMVVISCLITLYYLVLTLYDDFRGRGQNDQKDSKQ